MIFLNRHFLIKYIYPIFILLYCLSLGTLVDRAFPFLRLMAMAISLLFFIHYLKIKNKNRYSIALLLGIFIFFWLFLSIRNILFGNPEGAYMLFIGAVIVILTPIILLRHPHEAKYLETSLFIFSACVIGYAILHYLVIVNILDISVLFLGYEPSAFGRVSGILVNPLNLGPFLILLINYILFCQVKNKVNLLVLAISVIFVLLTGNRSSFGLLLVTAITYEFFHQKKFKNHLIYLMIAIGLAWLLIPPNFYEFYINRGLQVFSVLFGFSKQDESFNQRIEQNTENLSIIFSDPLNFLFGPGYSPRVTDSDVVTFLTHYGIFFTVFFYGLIISGILFIGIPRKNRNAYDALRIFLCLTTFQMLLGSVFVEGMTAPAVSGYYFAFLGVTISLKIHYNNQKNKKKLLSSIISSKQS